MHLLRLQDGPVNGGKQTHSPVSLSQIPALEHSTTSCAFCGPMGTSAIARPAGQAPRESKQEYA